MSRLWSGNVPHHRYWSDYGACPRCHAEPGDPCRTASDTYAGDAHAGRPVLPPDTTEAHRQSEAEGIERVTYVTSTRREIEQLEGRLMELYAIRKAMILEVADSMTRREIAEQWGISNVRVTTIVNGGSAWRAPDACPVCRARGDDPCTSSNGKIRSDHAGRHPVVGRNPWPKG